MRSCIAFPSVTMALLRAGGVAPGRCGMRAFPLLAMRPPGVRSLRRYALTAVAIAAFLTPCRVGAQDWFALLGPGPVGTPGPAAGGGDCSGGSTSPSSGCPTASDDAPFAPLRDFRPPPDLAPGIDTGGLPESRGGILTGYGPEPGLPGRASSAASGGGSPGSALRESLTELLSPYVDLPAIGRYGVGSFSPFIGGGMGAVRMRTGEARMSFPKIGTIVPGESRVGRAWTVTAGLALTMGSRSTLQLSWRYVDLFADNAGAGSGRVEWREHGPAMPLPDSPTSAEMRSHWLRLSVHYGF